MKVLHLISDWKWTGPAEPALEMARGLRTQGVDAQLAVTRTPFQADGTVRARAISAGIPLHENFHLKKHFHLRFNITDAIRLAKFIKEKEFQLIHCHRHQDHLIGGYAARKAGIPVVRSSHDGVQLKNSWRNRYALKKATDLFLPVSQTAASEDEKNFLLLPSKIKVLPPAIDTDVFDPNRIYKDMREALNIPKNKVLIGICARMQPYRYFKELLDSWVIVKQNRSDVHFVIVGRGSHMNEVAMQPAKERGLDDCLTFAGYHSETYIDMINALDVKMFMVAGTDGSCRALRQALSLGIPAVTSNRGMIPEIVLDGENGFVTDGSPEAMAKAQIRLLENESLRRKFSSRAREISVEKYSLIAQSRKLIDYYSQLV